MKKILIIGKVDLCNPEITTDYVIHETKLLKVVRNPFLRMLRSYFFAVHSSNQFRFLNIGKISSIAKHFEEIILFDSTNYEALNELALQIERNIDKNKTKLHFYLWNKVRNIRELSLSNLWSINTFDRTDAIKYGFRYIGTFYVPTRDVLENKNCTIDCFFVGTNKGRFSYISKLEKILKIVNCTPYFIYVSRWSLIMPWKYSKSISYKDVQRYVCHSKSILDVTAKGQFGLTLRFMEGIFFNKKVITNNALIKQYSFYDERKILVIDEHTDPSKIKSFINSDAISYGEECKNQYTFSAWLNRIVNTDSVFNDTIL